MELGNQPLDQQFGLAQELGFVVGRQALGHGFPLQVEQEVDRGTVEFFFVSRVAEDAVEQIVAQVFQQHETGLGVGGDYFRRAQAMVAQPLGHADERIDVELVGWRIHQDRRAGSAAQTLVAPYRGIAGQRDPDRLLEASPGEKIVNRGAALSHRATPSCVPANSVRPAIGRDGRRGRRPDRG